MQSSKAASRVFRVVLWHRTTGDQILHRIKFEQLGHRAIINQIKAFVQSSNNSNLFPGSKVLYYNCYPVSPRHDKYGIGYEADPRHVEIINHSLLLQEAKAVSTPGTKEEGRTTEDNEEPLSEEQATKYRALVARCN